MLDNGTKQTNYNMEKTLMDLQKLMPQQAQPISRITNGQLPTDLAELTEEVLGDSIGSNVLPSAWEFTHQELGLETLCAGLGSDRVWDMRNYRCSYDGDDAE
jgi:bacteriocin leader peptide (microcyclamide/patellamide family)